MKLAVVLLVLHPIVIAQQRHIEEQLHVMGPLSLGRRGIGIARNKGAAACFLLHQNAQVELQHIHTSLQA